MQKEQTQTIDQQISDEQLKSDKLRNTPMGKLLFNMALPAIISMLIESLYNIVDGMFVSALDSNAFDALGIGRPLIMIVIAVGIGLGVGANVFVARQLGFGDREKANQVAKTSFVLAIVAWLLFVVLAFVVFYKGLKRYSSSNLMVARI